MHATRLEHPPILVGALVLALAACDPGAGSPSGSAEAAPAGETAGPGPVPAFEPGGPLWAEAPGGFALRDSAAVRIAESEAPAWTEATAWRLAEAPELVIGTDTTELLYRVRSVRVLRGGTLVMHNSGSHAIWGFDPAGERLFSIREGEGPGEVQFNLSIHPCDDGGFTVVDARRVSRFDSAGEFIDSESIGPHLMNRMFIVGVGEDCTRLLLQPDEASPRPYPTEYRYSRRLVWGATPTDLDTVLHYDGREVVLVPGARESGISMPWGLDPVWTEDDDRIWFGPAGAPEVQVYEPDGSLARLLRWAAHPRPVTEEDHAMFEARRAEWLERNPERGGMQPALDEYPALPTERPHYSGLLVDDEGKLWVRDWPRSMVNRIGWEPGPADPPITWWVFGREGRWLGGLAVPAGMDVQTVAGDRLVVVEKDEMEVETVAVYPIVKPGG